MAVGIESRVRKSGSGFDNNSSFCPTHQETTMSYAPPPPQFSTGVGLPVTETGTPLTPTDRFGHDLSHPAQGNAGAPMQSQTNKKRRPSKGKIPSEIRRSSSTPHMRNLALVTSGELSPTTNKQRNKLGYHRTSVACGHCRRRKIRCIVAPDDPQGRCANCIRLKKECNFHPVEQSPETHRAQGKERGAKELDPSAPTSPHQSTPTTGDSVEEYGPPLSGHPSNSSASKFGLHHDIDVDPAHPPHLSDLSIQHSSAYRYSHPADAVWTNQPFLTPSSLAEISPSSTGYWRPSTSTTTSNYGSDSNMSGGQTPATMNSTSSVPYQDSHGWNPPTMQPPSRSMSYGNIEGLHQYHGALHHPEYRGRAPTYPYPTSIDTNQSSIQATSPRDAAAAPLSAPILASQPYGYPPGWNPYIAPGAELTMQNPPSTSQWYPEPTQLDQVQEETAPPISYDHGNVQGYYAGS